MQVAESSNCSMHEQWIPDTLFQFFFERLGMRLCTREIVFLYFDESIDYWCIWRYFCQIWSIKLWEVAWLVGVFGTVECMEENIFLYFYDVSIPKSVHHSPRELLAASTLLSNQREQDLFNIQQHPSVPEATMATKIRCTAEGSWSFPRLLKNVASEKQQGVASNNSSVIAVSVCYLWQAITQRPNKRATPHLECTMRWIHTINEG